MATTLTGTATLDEWVEDPAYDPDAPLPRLAGAVVKLSYEGDLVGTSTTRYAMSYSAEGGGESAGYEAFTGTLGGEQCTVVFRLQAEFAADHSVKVAVHVVPGSGTGALTGATGGGSYVTTGQTWSWALEVDR